MPRPDPSWSVYAAPINAVLQAAEQLGADPVALLRAAAIDPARLQQIEDRYFALKDVARKHQIGVDELPALRARIGDTLAALEDQGGAREVRADAWCRRYQ